MSFLSPTGEILPRTFFDFDAGPVTFQGSTEQFSGTLLFEFPHKHVEPNEVLMAQFRRELTEYVSLNFSEESQAHCAEIMDDTVNWLFWCMPKAYHQDDPVNRKKRLSYGKFTFMAWLHKCVDQQKRRTDYWEFCEWLIEIMREIMRGGYLGENGLEKLKGDVESSTWADYHPCVWTYFHSCYLLAKDLREDWGFEKDNVYALAKSCRRQYEHNYWLDQPKDEHVDNFSLRKTLRFYNIGGVPFLTLMEILDGVDVEITEEERQDKHYRRLKYLMVYQCAHVNDLFTLKNDIADEEVDNLILLYFVHKDPPLMIEGSVKRLIKKYDWIHEETQQIMEYMNVECPRDSCVYRQIQHLESMAEGIFDFHLYSKRWAHNFTWKIETRTPKELSLFLQTLVRAIAMDQEEQQEQQEGQEQQMDEAAAAEP